MWNVDFSTDPLHDKAYLGDTSTGYGVLSYKQTKNLKLVIKGSFPYARFFSFETQDTQIFLSEDALFDYNMVPDEGSENPFLEGTSLQTKNRNYTVTFLEDKKEGDVNTVRLPHKGLTQSIMMRIYTPHDGVKLTEKDLPKVYAYDAVTGKEASCPMRAPYMERFFFPQALADIYSTVHPDLSFKLQKDTKLMGMNKAITYMYGVAALAAEDVFLIRFKAPTFNNTQSGSGSFHISGNVRYWSVCAVSLPTNVSKVCLPDHLARIDANGYVNIVLGHGDDVKKAALERGYSYLPDHREPNQKVYGLVYRNMIPAPDFKLLTMFQGNYIPVAKRCSAEDFLNETCAL